MGEEKLPEQRRAAAPNSLKPAGLAARVWRMRTRAHGRARCGARGSRKRRREGGQLRRAHFPDETRGR